ncbi:MAG: GNAT family N-acetyltransferase [Hyphomicrobiales bacterium]
MLLNLWSTFWQRPPVLTPAELADAPALAELHEASFARGWSVEEFESLLADRQVLTVVARRSGPGTSRRPVGFVMVRRAADEAEVLTVAVAASQRGKGLGRDLMEEAMRRLYADRIATLFLEVSQTNEPACRLYRRLGFATVGERKGYYAGAEGAATGALVMRANLR